MAEGNPPQEKKSERKNGEDPSIHDEVVSWFLYSSMALVGAVGVGVGLSGEKLTDFLAYSLPTMAGICVGANLVRQKSERSIWIVSVVLLLGGFNFFLATLKYNVFYYAVELALLLNLLVFTLIVICGIKRKPLHMLTGWLVVLGGQRRVWREQ